MPPLSTPHRPRAMHLRRCVGVLLCAGLLDGCGRDVPPPGGGRGATARRPASDSLSLDLVATLDSFVVATVRAHPVWGTEIGLHLEDGRLDDVSASARERRILELHDFGRRLALLEQRGFSVDDRVDLGVVADHVRSELFDLEELRVWADDPHRYTQLAGRSVHLLLVREHAPLEARLDSVTSRLGAWPRLFAQARDNLDRPPRVRCEAALRQCESLLRMLDDDLPAVVEASSSPPQHRRALARAVESARASVVAFQDFIATDLMSRADGDFRLGPERYEKALRLRLRTGLSSDAIRERAIAESRRVRRTMYELALPLLRARHPHAPEPPPGAAGVDAVVRPVLAAIAADHPRADELLDVCRAALDSLQRFCRANDLLSLESQPRLRVEWTPDFARGLAAAGLEPPGVLEPGLPVIFQVQPVPRDWSPEQVESFLSEYNRDMLQVLVVHEAMPGHFVQLCHAEHTAHPIRNIFANDAFVEGWAVYAEHLVMDAGYGNGDVRLQLAACKLYLRTVLNARIDIGVHCEDMSEDEAIGMLVQEGFQEATEARAKWIRAQLGATQLASYFVGYQEIADLEAEDRDALGASWTRRDFVDRLLAHGSPSVADLRLLLAAHRAALVPSREATP